MNAPLLLSILITLVCAELAFSHRSKSLSEEKAGEMSDKIKGAMQEDADARSFLYRLKFPTRFSSPEICSNFATPVIYDGTADASSIYSDNYVAQNAFNQENPDARWCSEAVYPGKIWFKFTSAVKVVKISFSSIHGKWWKESPKAFDVIASNDCINWDILLSVTNSGFTGKNQEKSWKIPCSKQKSYQCYGIKGTENLGYSWLGIGYDYISLKKLKMFQDIDDCAKDPCDHGTCKDELNGFTCTCDPGWEGKQCHKDIDDCSQNPCKHGACQDRLNDFICACDAGWKGKTCEQKTCKSLSDSVTPVVYDGTADASSIYSDDYVAQYAFNEENSKARWCSEAGYPGKIWFKFTSAVKVVKISFSSIHGRWWKETPKAFDVMASNDCINWDILLSVTNSGFTGGNQEKFWQIPCFKQKSYQCYGIKGTENLGYGKDFISLKKLMMFK